MGKDLEPNCIRLEKPARDKPRQGLEPCRGSGPAVAGVLPACGRQATYLSPTGIPLGEENFVFVAENEEHDLWHEFLCLTCIHNIRT